MRELRLVIDVESDPPRLLGTLVPSRADDEYVVRYFDSGDNEAEHRAPEDCVQVVTVQVCDNFYG